MSVDFEVHQYIWLFVTNSDSRSGSRSQKLHMNISCNTGYQEGVQLTHSIKYHIKKADTKKRIKIKCTIQR
jgi:hypothetical protein